MKANGNIEHPTSNVEHREGGKGTMDALGCDSPLTQALSPLRGEGGECDGVSTSPQIVCGSHKVGKGSTPTEAGAGSSRPTGMEGAQAGAPERLQQTRASAPLRGAGGTPAVRQAGGLRYEGEEEPIIKFRAAQREFLRGVEQHRLVAFVARRQFGKTTTFAALALKKMMKRANHTVVFGSAKLNLAREIVRKEAEVIQRAIAALAKQAEKAEGLLQVVDGKTGRMVSAVTADDFASLYEAQRLEFRFYHSKTIYSRTKVVALRADTVGETGDLMCDEIGRVKNWREVWEAVEPIVSSNPKFRVTLATTPPPDDSHYSFEMLSPKSGTEFEPCATGNWYRSEAGVMVLRVDALDAWADGVPVYDLERGEPLSPDEHRARALDKDAWDRNYAVKFVFGGTAACGLLQLESAQARGIGSCSCIVIEDEADMTIAMAFLRDHLTNNPVGIGLDLATTEKETSNPTALTVMESSGVELTGRLTLVWKTRDPAVSKERVRRVVKTINERSRGGPARRLCIDATNERYFAIELSRDIAGEVPVELIVGSESAPGINEDAMVMKAYLGNLLIGELEDNHLTLAPERYLKEDFRLVKRDRGSFSTDTAADGKHGDTFDAHKLALWALRGGAAGAVMSVEGIRMAAERAETVFRPRRLRMAA